MPVADASARSDRAATFEKERSAGLRPGALGSRRLVGLVVQLKLHRVFEGNMNLWNHDHLVCINLGCRAEFLVIKPPQEPKLAPVCACGSPLKKVYRSPQLRILDESERVQVEGSFALKRTSQY